MENEKIIDVNGYKLHLIPTKKFKTIDMVAKFKTPLNRDIMTKRALLPYLLQQGPQTYPNRTVFQTKLDNLYGAGLSIDGTKKGNYHIMSFRLQVANQNFIKNEFRIISEAILLFKNIIFNPNVTDGAFDSQVFNREKEMLKRKIKSIEDDKMSYANMRLIDEMCMDELYSLHLHGYIEDLEKITSIQLYDYYQQMLKHDQLDIFLVGDFNIEELTELFTSNITREYLNKELTKNQKRNEHLSKDIPQEIIEKQSIQQAKLHIGYRTNVRFEDDDYFALQLFNGILGAFPSSKLFINVREKNSLAYYAASRIESHKGLLFVLSGIAPVDYKKTKEIIEEQINAMKNGDFTEQNIQETKKLIVNQLLETLDNPQGIIEMFYQQIIGQRKLTPDVLINRINQVSKQEIITVANKIVEDTVYFLTNEGDEPHE